MELKLSQSSLPTPIFNPSSLFPKHFALLSQRWKLNFQRITWKGHVMSKKILVHVVKEGETLTSISKLYGVPVLEIADSNKEIADVNIVFEGQRLQIPSAVAESSQFCDFAGHLFPNGFSRLGFRMRQWKNQIFTIPFHQFPILCGKLSFNLNELCKSYNQAKTPGSFPVLVALVALCIGCIMGVFQIILAKKLRKKAAHKSPNSARWRTALSDLRDPDSPDAEPAPDSDPLPDDKEKVRPEDVSSRAYNKLEGDYEKFLSECGMSSYGYWRGGSPQ